MIIKNVLVFGEDKTFALGEIAIENGVIVEKASDNSEVIDGNGCFAVPGLIDLHFHGCVGDDFCDGSKEAIRHIADYQASVGVAAIAPATMTLAADTLEGIMKTAADYKSKEHSGAELVGINMEGPFISEAKKGAQAAKHIRPCDVTLFRQLQEASGGLIKLVDIAPEGEGAMEFIEELKDDVRISIAHTTADYDTAKQAYDKGAKHATHLYNAMPPFTHREPGVIGAAHDSDCMVELICDGVHIHPSVVRTTFDMFGAERIILISDSMRATGMPDGDYTLGGQAVKVVGNKATLVSDGALAGSVTNLMDCLRTAVLKMGIPLEDAVACATANPAKALGIDDRYGSIAYGKAGKIVLMDKDLNVKNILF